MHFLSNFQCVFFFFFFFSHCQQKTIAVPRDDELSVSGTCLNAEGNESELILQWNSSYSVSLTFKRVRSSVHIQ